MPDGVDSRGRDLIVDPADGKLPMQTWARAENDSRSCPSAAMTIRPRTVSSPESRDRWRVPSLFHIVQTAGMSSFFERMAWRIVPTDGRAHLRIASASGRGDSVGRWDGDTLVVETAN
jgi:hypothetical protein